MTETVQKNTALRRIKYLCLLQAGERLRKKTWETPGKHFLFYFLRIVAVCGITAALTGVFAVLDMLFSIRITPNMFISVLFISQLLSVFTSLGNVISVLYTSKENAILLVYPCRYHEIFISKLVIFALDELKKSLYFLIPFLVTVGILGKPGFAYFLLLIPMWILLCLLPLLIAAALSIPVVYLKRFLESRVLVYSTFATLGLLILYLVILSVLSKVPQPLSILSAYSSFIKFVEKTFADIASYALWYKAFGNAMFGINVGGNLLSVAITFVVWLCLAFAIALPFYFKAASSTAENSSNQSHRQHFVLPFRSLFLTFFRKEWRIMTRTSERLISVLTVVLLFPMVGYVMNFIIAAINTTALGDYLTVAFNVMITLSLLGTSNANCAMSISSEGSEFAILKTAPSKTSMIVWSKVAVTALVDLLATLAFGAMMLATMPAKTVFPTLVLIFIVSLSQILWSFELDVRNPKIADYSMKGDAVTDNSNVMTSVVIGFVISVLFGFGSMLLLYDDYYSGWVRLFAIALAFLAFRIYLLASNLKVYFNEIQM